MPTNLKSLITKLNGTCRNALELAAALCLSQTHYEVDVEHFLIKLLELAGTDFQKILRHFEINEGRLAADQNGKPLFYQSIGEACEAGHKECHQ
jgi:type VI secretion system protein VasG